MTQLLSIFATMFTFLSPIQDANQWRMQPIDDLVNWKVGDTAKYSLKVSFFKGTAVRAVTSEIEVGGVPAIWVTTNIKIVNQKQKIQQLIRRHDATILKLIVNGKEEEVPDPADIEVVDQDYRKVTVPAGTFDSVWMKINIKETKNIQTWINPKDTVMDGLLKMVTPTQFGSANLELTSFKKVQKGQNN